MSEHSLNIPILEGLFLIVKQKYPKTCTNLAIQEYTAKSFSISKGLVKNKDYEFDLWRD